MPDKQFLISWVAVFLTTMIFGYVVFGVLMADFWADPANTGDVVVRPEGSELMEWVAIANLIFAYVFVRVWRHGYEGTGIGEGVRYGLMMGVFWGTFEMINYAFMPVPMNTMMIGFAGDVAMFVVAGIVLAKVYPAVAE